MPSRRLYWDLLYWENKLRKDAMSCRVPPEEWVRGVKHLVNTIGMVRMVLDQEGSWRDVQHSLRIVRRTFLRGLHWMARSRQIGDGNALARELAAGRLVSRALRDH